MANEEHLKILNRGIAAWNTWRSEHPRLKPDLNEVNLYYGNDNGGADLRGANLREVQLAGAALSQTDLRGVDLSGAALGGANLVEAKLEGANLTGAYLNHANLNHCLLSGANLNGAILYQARLMRTDLRGASLVKAQLQGAVLIETDIEGAELTGSNVYGISTWDLRGVPKDQSNLVITPSGVPTVTVDDLKVAQFVYLLLHNPNIRDIIDTIGKKGVLLLGRFGGRLPVLNALRLKLREAGFVPMVFDFERAASRDFTETVMTLAGMSAFIIADITKPRSVQQELQATIPNFMIPFVPIIEGDEEPYSMFKDFLTKYDKWVLNPLRYDSLEQLSRITRAGIIGPALERRETLLAEKANQIQFRSGKDYEQNSN